MSIWDKLKAAAEAVKYGKQLENSATWKERTARLNSLVGLLTVLATFIPGLDNLDHDTLFDIALGISGVYVALNNYMHYATSAKVGV